MGEMFEQIKKEAFNIKGKRLIWNGKFYEYADEERYKKIFKMMKERGNEKW